MHKKIEDTSNKEPQTQQYSGESESEHSFEYTMPIKAADNEYISTNLIHGENLTLNEICIYRQAYSDIEIEVREFLSRKFTWKWKT